MATCSGTATHPRTGDAGPNAPLADWAQEFDAYLSACILGSSVTAGRGLATRRPVAGSIPCATYHARAERLLLAAPAQAPHFARAHPRVEHLLPLYVAVGAADPAAAGSGAAAEVGAGGEQVEAAAAAPGSPRLVTTPLFSQIVNAGGSMAAYRFD